MPAERAGYTVTMFLLDVSKSMGSMREVVLPDGPDGEERTAEITHLDYALQYVKLKIQELIYSGRKTEKCGVIIFGSDDTNNTINKKNGGYENVTEYIPVATPTAATLAKLDKLETSSVYGDPIDALIVGIQTQDEDIGNKKTWSRKIILVTDAEGPIELEDWEATVDKMNALNIAFTVVGVDFDDENLPFEQEDKPKIKRTNEKFFKTLTDMVNDSNIGNLEYALMSVALPELKVTKSVLMTNVLRLGDCETRPDEAVEILIRSSKCTAITRPKAFKKFGIRRKTEEEIAEEESLGLTEEEKNVTFVQLKLRSEYFVDKLKMAEEDEDIKEEDIDVAMEQATKIGDPARYDQVEKEDLIRGFKYGTSYAPCPDGQFPKLPTKKGIDICGFFDKKLFRRDYSMGEIQYIWGDPGHASSQCALSSIVQAMYEKGVMAIGRWVSKDGMDPKMGVLEPVLFDNVQCLLWAQMPFADDVRKYTFASLDRLVNKKGEVLNEHPYLPTEEQQQAMDDFVDAMDLMQAGEKDEETGKRAPWFDTRDSYNPALHRLKQAMFHCAVVPNLDTYPLPPPHPELTKYFKPPKRVTKYAKDAVEELIKVMKVRQVPKQAKRVQKSGHDHARDDENEPLLLDRKSASKRSQAQLEISGEPTAKKEAAGDDSVTEDEDEDEGLLLNKQGPSKNIHPLPTPARSLSPDDAMDVDPQRDPDRLIGRTDPLKDFKKNLERGDVVTKAVEDMCNVIEEVVLAPFASRRTKEMIKCLKELRDTCLKEDEIEAWNAFLPKLKARCNDGNPGNDEFWWEVENLGRDMSLISDIEAKQHGGRSDVSEAEATEFLP